MYLQILHSTYQFVFYLYVIARSCFLAGVSIQHVCVYCADHHLVAGHLQAGLQLQQQRPQPALVQHHVRHSRLGG